MIHTATLAEWRVLREEELRRPDGWLSLAGLFDVPCSFEFLGRRTKCTVEGDEVWMSIDEAPASKMELDAPIAISESATATLILRFGKHVVRLRDAKAKTRVEFRGMKWFEEDAAWILKGKFVAQANHDALVQTERGLSEKSEFAGFVEFCAPGNQQVRLWADKNDKDELFIVFKDQTAKTGETYGAGRFLYAQVEKDNSVTLDFNRGYNPACAFTEFALCPLPVKENVLPFPIRAGERKPE